MIGMTGTRWIGWWTGGVLTVGSGCSDGEGPTRSLLDDAQRMSLLIVEEAPAGSEAVVRLDSVGWRPTLVLPAPGQTLEISGDYAIGFYNDSDTAYELRDDLRFYDDDDFLIDNYIPFSLPVRLEPRMTTWQKGQFVLRGEPDAARYGLRTLRIVIRLTVAAPQE